MSNQKSKAKAFSLIQPMAMGGIHGGDGYTFQDRFIVCKIPKWISNPAFIRIMPEGTGDVDVVFRKGRKYIYDHYQVKDHTVTDGEFREVIEAFTKIDEGTGKTYRQFILVAPSTSPRVKSLCTALTRYREGVKLLGSRKATATTKADLKVLCEKIGLGKHFNLFLQKFELEIIPVNFNDNEACKKIFISDLLEHPKYKEKIVDILKPAYSILIDQVLAHRGKVLEHVRIHSFIDGALTGNGNKAGASVLHIHNWTLEKFVPDATHMLDWTSEFDRQTRKVPDADVWNNKLIPELHKIRDTIARATSQRLILFRGKTTLTTGLALGAAFPENGNWIFELLQPPQITPWRSDVAKIKNYKLKYREIEPVSVRLPQQDSEIVFIFNITGAAFDEVVDYLRKKSSGVKILIVIEPTGGSGNYSIQNDSEAVALANATKEVLKSMLIKHKAGKTHLFYYGPLALAIFLGQKLTSVGEIQLYEFQNPGYKPSGLIKT